MRAEEIKSILEESLCPVHDIHPVVEITGDNINIACCCEYFSNYCKVEAEYMGLRAPTDIIESSVISSHN